MKFTEFNQLKRETSFENAWREVGKSEYNNEKKSEEFIREAAMFIIAFAGIAILAPIVGKAVVAIAGADAIHAIIVK